MTLPPNFATLSPRQKVVAVAQWGVVNRSHFSYSQGPHRWDQITKPWALPIMTDCSGWATTCFSWSHLPDPNGQHYSWGYTGTLVTNGHEVSLADLEVGDLVIYGPGTGEHVAIVTYVSADPMTISMGTNGDPRPYRVSEDGRPHRYFRFLPSEKKKVKK